MKTNADRKEEYAREELSSLRRSIISDIERHVNSCDAMRLDKAEKLSRILGNILPKTEVSSVDVK